MARRKRPVVTPDPEPLPETVTPDDLVDPRAWLLADCVGIDHRLMTPDERLAWARENTPAWVHAPDSHHARQAAQTRALIARRRTDAEEAR
jgi:hypothetical protein